MLEEPFLAPSKAGLPAMTKMSHTKVVAAESSEASLMRMTWPQLLTARGLASSTAGRAEPAVVVPSTLLLEAGVVPRRLLLVQARNTSPDLVRLAATHSGRSIMVAPTRSAAWRALISTSAWLAKPFSAVKPFCPCTSGSQVPTPWLSPTTVPASKRATYKMPASSRLAPEALLAGS